MSDSIIPSATFGLINTDDASAQASHILNPYTAYARGTKLTGSMANHGNVSATLNAGGAYTIPAGYHAGGGVIRANSLAAQTGASATASDILSGKTAWVNGNLVTGNFSNVSPFDSSWKMTKINFTFTYAGINNRPDSRNTMNIADYGITIYVGTAVLVKPISISGTFQSRYNTQIYLIPTISSEGGGLFTSLATCYNYETLLQPQSCLVSDDRSSRLGFTLEVSSNDGSDTGRSANFSLSTEFYFMSHN